MASSIAKGLSCDSCNLGWKSPYPRIRCVESHCSSGLGSQTNWKWAVCRWSLSNFGMTTQNMELTFRLVCSYHNNPQYWKLCFGFFPSNFSPCKRLSHVLSISLVLVVWLELFNKQPTSKTYPISSHLANNSNILNIEWVGRDLNDSFVWGHIQWQTLYYFPSPIKITKVKITKHRCLRWSSVGLHQHRPQIRCLISENIYSTPLTQLCFHAHCQRSSFLNTCRLSTGLCPWWQTVPKTSSR